MKILILANHFNTLRIFRRELIKAIADLGHEVIVSIPSCDDENKKILESYGAKIIFTDFERRGMNPLKDLKLFFAYRRLLRTVCPDKVIAYTIKCNIYGGLACKLSKLHFYANVTGLGSTFQKENLAKKLVTFLYKLSLNRAKIVFFENIGNSETLIKLGCVKKDQAVVLPGAGVNLDEFAFVPYPEDNTAIKFLFVGRIMREKGVDEYFEAIKRIKPEFQNVQFHFIGWYEDNYEPIVNDLVKSDYIHFHGFQPNVKPFIENSHCVVLPSWHEGMSNTLLESAAMGRPLITSNIHGCKEAVVEKVSGFLIEPQSADSLYTAMKQFLNMSLDSQSTMGSRGRDHMIKNFDKNMVVNLTLKNIF